MSGRASELAAGPPRRPDDAAPTPVARPGRGFVVALIVILALVVAMVGAAVVGLVALVRSQDHPRSTVPARAALSRAVVSVTADAASVDAGALRAAVERELVGWAPRNVHVDPSVEPREVTVGVRVQVDADHGFLDLNGAEDRCLVADARLGGQPDVYEAADSFCDQPEQTRPSAQIPGPNVWEQRIRDSEAAFRSGVEAYAATHRPPYDRVALRETLAALSLPAKTFLVAPTASVAVSLLGDIGIAVPERPDCLLAWLGADGGLQLWRAQPTTCDGATALAVVPLGRP